MVVECIGEEVVVATDSRVMQRECRGYECAERGQSRDPRQCRHDSIVFLDPMWGGGVGRIEWGRWMVLRKGGKQGGRK